MSVRINPDIFRSYDIRGIYNRDFDVSFAEEFGNKVALALQAKTLVIGRDRRVSSDALEKALVQGVILAGVRVLEIGECTTPSFYYSVHATQSEGGIMITASHNPQEYNGFKVVGL
ncbi:MAG: phosphomannomutase, partial [Patescibacteria group bacterium]